MTQSMKADNTQDNADGYALIALLEEGYQMIGVIRTQAEAEKICNQINEYHFGHRDDDTWYDEHPARYINDELEVDECRGFEVRPIPSREKIE